MRYAVSLVSAALLGVLAFTGTALAAGAVSPDDGSLLDLARPVLDAIMSGHYAAGAALALVLAVALARRYGVRYLPWLASDEAGAALVLAGSFGGAMATALLAGAPLSLALAWMSLQVAAGGAGVYVLAKKLLTRPLRWLQGKLPAWARPAIDVVLWIFNRPTAGSTATAAGAAAVTTSPGAGVESLVGETDEVP